jgi:integrase
MPPHKPAGKVKTMGNVYRETYTLPLPADAELFARNGETFARWRDKRGRKQIAKLAGDGNRVAIKATTYTARYRNGSGLVCKVSTGCRTLDAAKAVLAELETRADKVRCGKWTTAEDSVLDHQATPLATHIDAYLDHLRGKRGKGAKLRVSSHHVVNVEHNLRRIVAGCGFARLRDFNRSAVEQWIKTQLAPKATPDAPRPLSARTINAHLIALTAFGNWCIESKRLVANPFTRPPKLDEKADRRRQRRALTDDELRRLLRVARLRPLAEFGRQSVKLDADKRQGRRTWTKRPLTLDEIDAATERGRDAFGEQSDLIAELERTGRERALIYKMLVLTGLRKAELASLTVGKLDLDAPNAYAMLAAVDEKAGRGADLPLRGDLATDLRQWIADRLEAVRSDARAAGEPLPVKLPHDAPLFNVPAALVRILDRDLAAAGIPKRDDRGRTIDVHAMRHTFGTHLSKAGVSPRTAQAAMRHSSIDLTMNTYTDPRLLDVAGAMDALPALPLDGDTPKREHAKATGTDGNSASPFLVRNLVPTTGNRRTQLANADTTGRNAGSNLIAANVDGDADSASLARHDKNKASVRGGDRTCNLQLRRLTDTSASSAKGALNGASHSSCTNSCTESGESAHETPVDAGFAEALAMIARLPLSDADKAEAVRRLLLSRDERRA